MWHKILGWNIPHSLSHAHFHSLSHFQSRSHSHSQCHSDFPFPHTIWRCSRRSFCCFCCCSCCMSACCVIAAICGGPAPLFGSPCGSRRWLSYWEALAHVVATAFKLLLIVRHVLGVRKCGWNERENKQINNKFEIGLAKYQCRRETNRRQRETQKFSINLSYLLNTRPYISHNYAYTPHTRLEMP